MMLHKGPQSRIPHRGSRLVFCALFALTSMVSLSLPAFAGADDLVRTPVDPSNRVALTGHHPAWASVESDQGAVPADLRLDHLVIMLARSPQREQAYNKFLEELQIPTSPNYHHWLTPAEQGKRFGPSLHDIQAVTAWLESEHLQVDAVSPSRDRITFSGAALTVGNAFRAEMHYFMVKDEKRISITAEPQVPAALKDAIKAISGLYTIKYDPQHKVINVAPPPGHNVASASGVELTPEGTYSCGNPPTPCFVVFPADFATIYNVNTPGIDGTGETIAIIGRSRVYDADIQNFEAASGLTVKATPETVIIPTTGTDPGPATTSGQASGDQGEATLDVSRSGSVAPGATIDLVVSASSQTQDGVDIATSYVVDAPVPAQIMSISFGSCEANAGVSGVDFWDSLFKTAAGAGMSIFVSSGDSGAAGCDQSFSPPPASQTASPNNICSSSFATCVGGTEFADFTNPSQYWNPTSNPTNNGSAKGPIPEGAWNEPMNGANFQVAGTGGGVSSVIATPTYQTGTGVPAARAGRYTPDVAYTASGHDGYFACLAGNNQCSANPANPGFVVFAGTSAAAPDMAGVAALLDQKAGAAQGLLNPNLYQLASNPANGVFNDVTVSSSGVTSCNVNTPSMCNNSTPSPTALTGGQAGFLVGAGFDEATGLGSINVAPLLANWPSSSGKTPTTTTLVLSSGTVAIGTSVTATATISPAPQDGETVTFNLSGGGITGSATALTTTGGTATVTVPTGTSTNQIPGGTFNVTASYPGDTTLSASTSTASTLNVEDISMTPNPLAITVTAPGQSGSGTITFGLLGGLTTAPSFACTGLPSESTCTFTAASATTETVMIGTTAASSLIDGPLGRPNRIFYAFLFPAMVGLLLPVTRRKSRARTMIGFVAVLVPLVLWLPACSSSSGPPHNPGTPVGQTNVTVTATSSTISHTITVNLNVQ
jgi:pseudomonalisin